MRPAANPGHCAVFHLPHRPIALFLASALLCLSGAVCGAEPASSPPSGGSRNAGSRAALEQEFWSCDYAATTRGAGLQEGAACVANYEELKQARFGGDAAAMLDWWRQNKAAQHQALSYAGRVAALR